MRRAGFVGYSEESGEYVIPAPAMIARIEKLIELIRAADSGSCSSLCAPGHEPCSVTESGACLGKAYVKAVPMLIGAARMLAHRGTLENPVDDLPLTVADIVGALAIGAAFGVLIWVFPW
jgi:hypothetical protein